MEVTRKDVTKTKEKQPLKEENEETEQKKAKYVLRNSYWREL